MLALPINTQYCVKTKTMKTTLTIAIIIASIIIATIYTFSNNKEVLKWNRLFFKVVLAVLIINIILHLVYGNETL